MIAGLLRHAARLGALVAAFAAVAAVSDWPSYRSLPQGMGVLTLSFSHGADRSGSCRRLTPEEIAELPANMRRTEICARRRPAVRVEIDIDGERLFAADLPPSGIAGDGPSRAYRRFVLPAGRYTVAARLRDRADTSDFTYSAERRIEIGPADHRVIDFKAEAGGFVFH